MSDDDAGKPSKPQQTARERRLAEQLRENLKRRKAKARASRADEPLQKGDSSKPERD